MTTVTVIIPAYQAADTLGRAIEAVLPQLVAGDELLILDDGSTDATGEVASSYQEVRVVRLEHNRGVAFARNVAAEAAGGELLIFTDADAALKPDVVEKMRERMSAPEAPGALVGLYAPECFADGAVSRFKNLWIRHTYLGAAPDIDFIFGCIFSVTRETYLAVGGMGADFQRDAGGGDIELGLRIRRSGLPIRLDIDLQAIHGRSFTVFELMENDYLRAAGYSRLGVDTHGVSGIASRARFANIPPTYLVGTAMVGLGLASLALLPWVPAAGVGLLTAVVVHTVVSMPVYAFMAREGDVGLALVSPVLLAVSQLAAGFGVLRGLARTWVA